MQRFASDVTSSALPFRPHSRPRARARARTAMPTRIFLRLLLSACAALAVFYLWRRR